MYLTRFSITDDNLHPASSSSSFLPFHGVILKEWITVCASFSEGALNSAAGGEQREKFLLNAFHMATYLASQPRNMSDGKRRKHARNICNK